MTDLKDLAAKLNLAFQNPSLIRAAFVHRSYLNESREFKESNERLEYLGDAVLELLTSDFLYHKYPGFQEGMLTNLRASLVRTESLARVASSLSFPASLLMSRGEEATGGRNNTSLLANTFEAFLGALYLDQGLIPCRLVLEQVLFPRIDDIVSQGTYKDSKSRVQELAQSRFKSTPKYVLLEEQGPDHSKNFRMVTTIAGREYGVGEGRSKQAAEEAAAAKTLELLTSS